MELTHVDETGRPKEELAASLLLAMNDAEIPTDTGLALPAVCSSEFCNIMRSC